MGWLGRRGLRRMFQTTSLLFLVVGYGLRLLEGGGLVELRLESWKGSLDAGDVGSSVLPSRLTGLVPLQLN